MNNSRNMRMTRQRRLILEELRKVKSHPTADEIYNMVRRKMPKISLGTVYRNLELLSSTGEIWKLSVGGSQKRFDGNIEPHSHVRCEVCGKVADVAIDHDEALNQEASRMTEYEILGHHLEFIGHCPDCQLHG